MDKSLLAIGQAGADTLEAFAAGLREKHPGETFIKDLIQVRLNIHALARPNPVPYAWDTGFARNFGGFGWVISFKRM